MKDNILSINFIIVTIVGGVLLLIAGIPVAKFLFPVLVYASIYTFLILLFVFLPLSFSKRFKKTTYYVFSYASYVFGLTAWIWAYLICMFTWGIMAVIIGLLFAGVGVIPMAVIASISQGDWITIIQLLIFVILAFASRGYAFKILERSIIENAISMEI